MLQINPKKFKSIQNKTIPSPMRPKFRNSSETNIYFYSKRKIVFLTHQAFALSPLKNIEIIVKEKNEYKKVLIKKDDCILNYFKEVLKSTNNNNFSKFYNLLIEDAKIRDSLYKRVK